MEEDDDIDRLFEQEEEDPSKTVLPVATAHHQQKKKKSSASKKTKTEELEEELRKLPTEKEKLRKLAEVAEKNAPVNSTGSSKNSGGGGGGSGNGKEGKSKKKKPKTAKEEDDDDEPEKVIPLFPHAGDVKRVEAMLFMTVEAAWRAQLPDTDERKHVVDELAYGPQATAFNKRCSIFSRQLKAALIDFFTSRGNTAMADVVNQLSSCTLHIFPQPKSLLPDKTPVCIWSGKPILEPSAVRSIALVPKKKEQEALAAAFHMNLNFVPVLKAIYTSMYFARIMTEKVTDNFSKVKLF